MSWQSIEVLARDARSPDEEAELLDRLNQVLDSVPPKHRQSEMEAMAESLAAGGHGRRLIPLLAAHPDRLPRLFAMLLATRMPLPLDAALVRPLRRLLLLKHVPETLRLDLATALLRTTGKEGPASMAILGALIAGLGKVQGLERLRLLERLLGKSPAVDDFRSRLENLVRITCPRCNIQLHRPEMAEHVWQKHRLVLDGLSIREPWKLIEDWIETYYVNGNADLLDRSRDLGRRLDPIHGLLRVQRLMLAHGIDDDEAQQDLLAEAGLRGASVCPRCFALVPPRDEPLLKPLNHSHGRLTTPGYRVEISHRGVVTRLDVETPRGVVATGFEPGQKLTRHGATLVFAGPLVLLAVLLNLVSLLGLSPLWPVLVTLLAATAVAAVVPWRWQTLKNPTDQAVDYAWERVVPLVHSHGFSTEDSAFLASLALTSAAGYGSVERRAASLQKLLHFTEKAVQARAVPATHVAALWRLLVEDAVTRGSDPVTMLVHQVARCFEGKLRIVFAEQLLGGEKPVWLNPGQAARLRVLLCERAFESGLEVADLVELGRIAPALGAALQTGQSEKLAQLRLLWSVRPRKPWDKAGPARTVFEVAADSLEGQRILALVPDLLLAVDDPSDVFLCGRGLLFQETLFSDPPRPLEVKPKSRFRGGGWDLVMGEFRFWYPNNPEELAACLRRWLYFHFQEFVPHVPGVFEWKAQGARVVRAQEVAGCLDCHSPLWFRPGEMALLADEASFNPK